MKHFLSSLLVSALALKGSMITCEAGVIPLVHFRATLDTDNRYLSFRDLKEGIIVGGTATYIQNDDHKTYHLPYAFDSAIDMFFDGTEWWMCLEEKSCLRCGQMLKAQQQ